MSDVETLETFRVAYVRATGGESVEFKEEPDQDAELRSFHEDVMSLKRDIARHAEAERRQGPEWAKNLTTWQIEKIKSNVLRGEPALSPETQARRFREAARAKAAYAEEDWLHRERAAERQSLVNLDPRLPDMVDRELRRLQDEEQAFLYPKDTRVADRWAMVCIGLMMTALVLMVLAFTLQVPAIFFFASATGFGVVGANHKLRGHRGPSGMRR